MILISNINFANTFTPNENRQNKTKLIFTLETGSSVSTMFTPTCSNQAFQSSGTSAYSTDHHQMIADVHVSATRHTQHVSLQEHAARLGSFERRPPLTALVGLPKLRLPRAVASDYMCIFVYRV